MSNFFKDLKLVGKATSTIEAINRQCVELQSRLDKLQFQQLQDKQDNALLILQLRKTNAQLELYFKRCQELKIKNNILVRQLDKFGGANSHYIDCEKIVIEQKCAVTKKISWSITDLFAFGECWGLYKFETDLNSDSISFYLQGGGGLIADSSASAEKVTFAKKIILPYYVEQVEMLEAEDFLAIETITAIVLKHIKSKKIIIEEETKTTKLMSMANDCLKLMSKNKLIYKDVNLVQIVIREGYEHICFRINRVIFNNYRFKHFVFRLGCGNIRKDSFGTDPKLEFPFSNGFQTLESWYVESEDEFGQKLELRFSTPYALDTDVWNSLSDHDKLFIEALINEIPKLIEKTSSELEWDFMDKTKWSNLSIEMLKILSIRK